MNYQCSECKKEVFSEIECDTRLCNRCAEQMYELQMERREWDYYHND